jgi:hypothetical protein
MTRTAADDFNARVRADLQRRRDQAAAEADALEAEIGDALNLVRKLDLERRRDRLVKAINAMDGTLAAST